jgi:hypothetical protein
MAKVGVSGLKKKKQSPFLEFWGKESLLAVKVIERSP